MVVHFACRCLNVRIHSRPDPPVLKDVTNIYTSEAVFLDPFFTQDTLVVTMDLGGVSKAQTLLCKDRLVDGWTVTTCVCCMIDICASRADELYRLLVNNKAETENHIDSVMKSPHYSRLFKLVLPDIDESFLQNNVGLELMHKNMDSSIEQVQKIVSNYLASEQKGMEESIRRYIENKHNAYADMLTHARKQKQAMFYLLLKSKGKEVGFGAEKVVSNKSWDWESPTLAITNDITNGSSTSADSVFDKKEMVESLFQVDTAPTVRYLRRTKSHNPDRSVKKNKPKKGPKKPPVNIDVGGVFDMEEFDSKEEYSDANSADSDASDVDDAKYKKSDGEVMCANSLPMSIPAFTRPHNFSMMDDDEDDDKGSVPKNPEDIAASIRALACSVRDGTEMFGELPRRRLNTNELVGFRH